MAAVHLTLIIFYHIITYLCSDKLKNKIELNFIKLVKKMHGFRNSPPSQQFELKATTCREIPDVTYRYNEYQEPLVGYSN